MELANVTSEMSVFNLVLYLIIFGSIGILGLRTRDATWILDIMI